MKRPMKISKQTSTQRPQYVRPKSIEEKLANTVLVQKIQTDSKNTKNFKDFEQKAVKLHEKEQKLLNQLEQEQQKPDDFSQLFKGKQTTNIKNKEKNNKVSLISLQSYNPDSGQFQMQQNQEAIRFLIQDLKVDEAAMQIGKQRDTKQEREELIQYYKQLANIPSDMQPSADQIRFQHVKEAIQSEIDQFQQELKILEQQQQQIISADNFKQILDQLAKTINFYSNLIELNDEANQYINQHLKGDKSTINQQYIKESALLHDNVNKLKQIRLQIAQKLYQSEFDAQQQILQDSDILPQINMEQDLKGSLRQVIPIQQLQSTQKILSDQQQQQIDKNNKIRTKVIYKKQN